MAVFACVCSGVHFQGSNGLCDFFYGSIQTVRDLRDISQFQKKLSVLLVLDVFKSLVNAVHRFLHSSQYSAVFVSLRLSRDFVSVFRGGGSDVLDLARLEAQVPPPGGAVSADLVRFVEAPAAAAYLPDFSPNLAAAAVLVFVLRRAFVVWRLLVDVFWRLPEERISSHQPVQTHRVLRSAKETRRSEMKPSGT